MGETSAFDREKVIELVRRHLEGLDIYKDFQRVDVTPDRDGEIKVCYEVISFRAEDELHTGFDLSFSDRVCFLNRIGLAPLLRGNGTGEAMYRLVEGIARDMGCDRVVQTPLGRTIRGESRSDYSIRRLGYVKSGRTPTELEKLLR